MDPATGTITTVIAVIGTLSTIVMGIVTWVMVEKRKHKDYVITEYERLVERIKAEYKADVVRSGKLEKEFLSCREEGARKEERIRELESQLARHRGEEERGDRRRS